MSGRRSGERYRLNIALIVFVAAFVVTFILRIPIGFGMIMSSIFYFLLADGPAAPVSMMAKMTCHHTTDGGVSFPVRGLLLNPNRSSAMHNSS